MIHLFFKKLGEPNFCGARMSIPDERSSQFHERWNGADTGSAPVLRIPAYPRGCEVAVSGEGPDGFLDHSVIGLHLYESHKGPPVGRRLVVAQEMVCPICLLLFTVMQANNTTSLNTARCILKREGKASR